MNRVAGRAQRLDEIGVDEAHEAVGHEVLAREGVGRAGGVEGCTGGEIAAERRRGIEPHAAGGGVGKVDPHEAGQEDHRGQIWIRR